MDRITKGRSELRALCIIAILADISGVLMYNYLIGPDKLFSQATRIIFSCALMYSTMTGSRIAKWILLFTFVYSIENFIKEFWGYQFNDWLGSVIFLKVAYNIFFVVRVLFSKNINTFLDRKRGKRPGVVTEQAPSI